MGEAAIVAIVTGLCTAIPIVVGQIFAHLATRKKIEDNNIVQLAKIEEVHKATNGLTDKLSAAKLLEGKAEGREQAKVEAARDDALIAQGALAAATGALAATVNGLAVQPTPVEVVKGAGITEPLKVDQHKDVPK